MTNFEENYWLGIADQERALEGRMQAKLDGWAEYWCRRPWSSELGEWSRFVARVATEDPDLVSYYELPGLKALLHDSVLDYMERMSQS